MADAADEPGPADAMGWGRAVEIPAMGSVLVAGHSPLGALVLRAAHAGSAPLAGATPLDCEEAAESVEVVDACDDSDELELDRCALFRGMKAPFGGPLSALHGCRLMFWYGDTTAVIGGMGGVVVVGEGAGAAQGDFSRDSRVVGPLLAARRNVAAPKGVRSGSDTRQHAQALMRCGSTMFPGVQQAGGGGERRVGQMSCAVRGSPCDVRANAGAADRHRAGQQAWRASVLRWSGPRAGLCDGRWWWACWMA
jgi:hypothetical protein